MEIYIILVNTESFLQCRYLCMVQCVHGQEEKNGKCTLAYIYIIYINIYKRRYRIVQYQVEKLYSKIRMSLDLVYSFYIL